MNTSYKNFRDFKAVKKVQGQPEESNTKNKNLPDLALSFNFYCIVKEIPCSKDSDNKLEKK